MWLRKKQTLHRQRISVKEFTATTCTTSARYLVLLEGELVIVCQFFATNDPAEREYNYVFMAKDLHHFGVTVRLKNNSVRHILNQKNTATYITGMINESRGISFHCSVHN